MALTGSTLTEEPGSPDIDKLVVAVVQFEPREHQQRLNWIPLAWSAVLIAAGLAYLFEWGPLVLHRAEWSTGGDLWGIFRAAHYVGWGFLGGVYDPSTGVNTLPGMSVLLAPLAMLTGALGLSESAPGIFLLHPTAALLIQPVELLLTCTVLFAVNSLAEEFGIRSALRFWLVGCVAVVAWPVAALWGHAEDVLALTFALMAIRHLLDGKSRRSGWLLGIGIVLQPLVALMLPIALGMSSTKNRVKFCIQAIVPSVLLAGIALAGNWSDAYVALVKQPTSPVFNHATPWVSLAPEVGREVVSGSETGMLVVRAHNQVQTLTTAINSHALALVSGGPVRTIGFVFAALIGLFVWRKRPDATGVIWLCGVALAMRCYFDPVMTPYYLAPPLIVALVAAARMGRLRFGIAAVVGLADTAFAYYRFSPWAWWLPVVGMLTIVLACGYPGRPHLVGGWPTTERTESQALDSPEDSGKFDKKAPVDGDCASHEDELDSKAGGALARSNERGSL